MTAIPAEAAAGRFMRREIEEQPEVVARLYDREGPAIAALGRRLRRRAPETIVLAARGTSDNAALYGRYLIETLLGIPVSLAAPSVLTVYRARLRLRRSLVIGLSQSGASPDIVEFVETARRYGARTIAVTNEAGSALSRAAHDTALLLTGRERSVAATKTYTAQLTALSLFVAAASGRRRLMDAHADLPGCMARTFEADGRIRDIAHHWRRIDECLVTSRGYDYATAREAALKLKETCYLVAEPVSAADLLHGPIAVVDEGFPVLLIAPPGAVLPHLAALASRLRRRRAGTLIASSDAAILRQAGIPLAMPAVPDERLSPHVYVLPLQLLAYHLSRIRGHDPDHPRGLHKITRAR
jgi:glucosamine--fructose-6-phosphate aminotransferase (isomerizing)